MSIDNQNDAYGHASKKVKAGVAVIVIGSAVLAAWSLWWTHMQQSSEDHSIIENAVATQKQLVDVVDRLSALHQTEDQKWAAYRNLCHRGKLQDTVLCTIAENRE